MVGDGMKHLGSTEKVRATDKQVEVKVPPEAARIHHHTQTQVVARSGSNGGAT